MEVLGGPLFAVAGAGESHGPAITTIVFGCPAGLLLDRADLQRYLDRRRPGGSRLGTPRHEADTVALLSGLYAEDHAALLAGPEVALGNLGQAAVRTSTYARGVTTGEPIAAVVLSAAGRAADYRQFAGPAGAVRPGHTDLVKFHKSSGAADVRGGGRSSFRATISDVIGGSVARLYLAAEFGTVILSSVCQVGRLRAAVSLAARAEQLSRQHPRGVPPAVLAELEQSLAQAPLWTLDRAFAAAAVERIQEVRKARDSLGAAVEVVALNVPALCGEPLYNSLKLRLMGALGGLHAAVSCEIGSGSQAVSRRGSQHNDPIRGWGYAADRHGGLIGGITTGAPLVCRVGFKPTASIGLPQQSVRKDLVETEFALGRGRHDPCVGVRAGVALESRLAIELMNAVLVHQARRVDRAAFRLFPRDESDRT